MPWQRVRLSLCGLKLIASFVETDILTQVRWWSNTQLYGSSDLSLRMLLDLTLFTHHDPKITFSQCKWPIMAIEIGVTNPLSFGCFVQGDPSDQHSQFKVYRGQTMLLKWRVLKLPPESQLGMCKIPWFFNSFEGVTFLHQWNPTFFIFFPSFWAFSERLKNRMLNPRLLEVPQRAVAWYYAGIEWWALSWCSAEFLFGEAPKPPGQLMVRTMNQQTIGI